LQCSLPKGEGDEVAEQKVDGLHHLHNKEGLNDINMNIKKAQKEN
jgi:hypothetical protein